MPIDESQLHPVFRATTVAQKKQEDALRHWKAVFYSLRSVHWKEACKNLRAEGLAKEELMYDENGEVVTTKHRRPILDYFNAHRMDFEEGYDRMFCQATIDEMVAFAQKHYGLSLKELLQINDERMARFRSRQSTRPYFSEETVVDPVAEEQERKKKNKKKETEPNF